MWGEGSLNERNHKYSNNRCNFPLIRAPYFNWFKATAALYFLPRITRSRKEQSKQLAFFCTLYSLLAKFACLLAYYRFQNDIMNSVVASHGSIGSCSWDSLFGSFRFYMMGLQPGALYKSEQSEIKNWENSSRDLTQFTLAPLITGTRLSWRISYYIHTGYVINFCLIGPGRSKKRLNYVLARAST